MLLRLDYGLLSFVSMNNEPIEKTRMSDSAEGRDEVAPQDKLRVTTFFTCTNAPPSPPHSSLITSTTAALF